MQSIRLESHADQDGILKLEVPVGIGDADFEVMVIIQPLIAKSIIKTPQELGWPVGFFEQTAGCLEDDPIERQPQGIDEVREDLI